MEFAQVAPFLAVLQVNYYVNVTNTGKMDADDVVLGFMTPPGMSTLAHCPLPTATASATAPALPLPLPFTPLSLPFHCLAPATELPLSLSFHCPATALPLPCIDFSTDYCPLAFLDLPLPSRCRRQRRPSPDPLRLRARPRPGRRHRHGQPPAWPLSTSITPPFKTPLLIHVSIASALREACWHRSTCTRSSPTSPPPSSTAPRRRSRAVRVPFAIDCFAASPFVCLHCPFAASPFVCPTRHRLFAAPPFGVSALPRCSAAANTVALSDWTVKFGVQETAAHGQGYAEVKLTAF